MKRYDSIPGCAEKRDARLYALGAEFDVPIPEDVMEELEEASRNLQVPYIELFRKLD